MKICFLILAHHQPRIFHRLIYHLSDADSDVIVHIDKRSSFADFAIEGRKNVHFIRRRNAVHWTGWSLTKTMCQCLGHGLKVSDAEYFIQLAGTDFPIRPMHALSRLLDEQYPNNFLSYYPVVPGTWGHKLIRKYRLIDLKAPFIDIRNPRKPVPHRFRAFMGSWVSRAEDFLNKRFLPRDTRWINFYSGSARWCLSRDTARFVVESFRSPAARRLRTFLRLSANSDEIFFQTVILNSSHKEQCLGFDEPEALAIFARKAPPLPDLKGVYLHYVDWSPEREDPAILDESDFSVLQQSGKYFACKFTDDRSLGLVDLIKNELLADEPRDTD